MSCGRRCLSAAVLCGLESLQSEHKLALRARIKQANLVEQIYPTGVFIKAELVKCTASARDRL
jgi:hypothetical protein